MTRRVLAVRALLAALIGFTSRSVRPNGIERPELSPGGTVGIDGGEVASLGFSSLPAEVTPLSGLGAVDDRRPVIGLTR